MDRRTFVKGATLGVASTALPFTANLARSAPAGPLVHHQRATAFRPFDELAEHYAPALRNLTPEQAVRRLYRGMLGISMPLPKGVDICVQYWERQGAEGPALTLRWFMQHPAFRFARPRDGRGYVASGVSKEIAAALTRWRQTDILYRTLWNRPPSVQESTGTLMTLAELRPMGRGGTTTVRLPRQSSSWITRSMAHAEMDYYQETYLATPWGPVPESAANQFRAGLIARGFMPTQAQAALWAVAAAAAATGSDIGVTVGSVAIGLADGTVDATVVTTTNAGKVSSAISLMGLAMLTLGVLVLTIKVTQDAVIANIGQTSPTAPRPNDPIGIVTVGDIVTLPDVDEDDGLTGAVADATSAPPDGNTGAGGSDGSDGAPE